MEVNARVNKALTQVRIEKIGESDVLKGEPVPMTLEDAKAAWNSGDISNCNLAFERLARNDFDIEALLQYYREIRECEGDGND